MTAFPIAETIDEPIIDLESQAALLRAVFEGADVTALIQERLDRLHADLTDAAAYVSLSLIYQLAGQRDNGLACLEAGLHYARLYRQPAEGATLRLLLICARGDLMTNTPAELMLEGRPVEVSRLYVDAIGGLPDSAPGHDVCLMAIGESDDTRPALERLRGVTALWPTPMLNDPAAVLDLARDRLWKKLQDAPGVSIPPTVRVSTGALGTIARGERDIGDLMPGGAFPVIVRPVGSHAGKGLERIDGPAALTAWLEGAGAEFAYVSPFVDYASADGKYRKRRIVFFEGHPHLAHMAIGDHWMVHYLNAGMAEDEAKRAEEAAAFDSFDADFAQRHAAAFAALHQHLGLGYFALDCAETADGHLLVFEADVSMIVHALDSETLYPYKKPAMAKLFAAFEALLRDKAGLSM
jgi:glutathione synthase/RimK-type ligase-like ATP-grasp enzyme